MSDVVIPYRFKVLGNTATNLAADTGIAKERELVVEIDTGRMKLGDGSTGYTTLPYVGWGHADFTGLGDKKVMAWNASGSKFAPVFLDAVDITYGVGNVDVALDDLFDALSDTVEEAPIDGKQYGRKDGEWVEITGGGGGGGGALEFVGSVEVTGSAATSMTISDLDLEADGIYILEWSLLNATGTTNQISITYNGDTTATNYRNQTLTANGGPGGSRTSTAVATATFPNECTVGRAKIVSDRSGRPTAFIENIYGPPTSVIAQIVAHYWLTAENVTSLTFTSAATDSIAVGSYVKIWKLTESSGGGSTKASASASVGVKSTTNTGIPYDGTIPQVTEGDEISELTVTITPASASSDLLVRLTLPAVASTVDVAGVRFAIFRDGAADAIAAACPLVPHAFTVPQVLEVVVPSNDAVETVFTVRWAVSAGTGYINRSRSVASLFGAASVATLSVQEL